MKPDPIKQIEDLTQSVHEMMEQKGKNVFSRYPLTFSLLGVFGVVAIVYGFEGLIDKIPYLRERPLLMLAIGIAALMFTGTLYRRLQKKTAD